MVLSPHTDDGEIGAGGTIAKFIEKGSEIFYLCFCGAEDVIPKGVPKDTLRNECRKATKLLGIKSQYVVILNYKIREFHMARQNILDDIILYGNKFMPDLILIPSSNDVHQDHHTINQEAIRAFKKSSSIWGYEHPWNNLTFTTDVFIELDKRHIESKISALKKYASQDYRTYLDETYIWSWANSRGTQIDAKYAETFELIRLLVK